MVLGSPSVCSPWSCRSCSCFYPGPNYGTDFKGGTEVEIAFGTPIDAGHVRSAVESAGFKGPDIVQVVDTDRPYHFLIRVQEVSAITDEEKEALRHALCFVEEGQPPPDDREVPRERARHRGEVQRRR